MNLEKEFEAKDQGHNEQLRICSKLKKPRRLLLPLEGEIDSLLTLKLNAVTKERDQLRTIERTNPSGSSSEAFYGTSMEFVMDLQTFVSRARRIYAKLKNPAPKNQ